MIQNQILDAYNVSMSNKPSFYQFNTTKSEKYVYLLTTERIELNFENICVLSCVLYIYVLFKLV